jgi:hypothetical protein
VRRFASPDVLPQLEFAGDVGDRSRLYSRNP